MCWCVGNLLIEVVSNLELKTSKCSFKKQFLVFARGDRISYLIEMTLNSRKGVFSNVIIYKGRKMCERNKSNFPLCIELSYENNNPL